MVSDRISKIVPFKTSKVILFRKLRIGYVVTLLIFLLVRLHALKRFAECFVVFLSELFCPGQLLWLIDLGEGCGLGAVVGMMFLQLAGIHFPSDLGIIDCRNKDVHLVGWDVLQVMV